ncbi:hypothetical protein TWF694_010103 [Orbilia ellipsospora]|uniref:C2H2-type domain-containing protein n=1 Tax=Orbilia ellipsospora TaxID=2528407 RepID=A0AAV9X8V9_9PEZI
MGTKKSFLMSTQRSQIIARELWELYRNVRLTLHQQEDANIATKSTLAQVPASLKATTVAEHDSTYESMQKSLAAVLIKPMPRIEIAAEANTNFKRQFCLRVLSDVDSSKKWRKHVPLDTRPHFCTFSECPSGPVRYKSKTEWMAHEVQVHRLVRTWNCNFKQCEDKFNAEEMLMNHWVDTHDMPPISSTSFSSLRDLVNSSRVAELDASLSFCKICQKELPNRASRLYSHIGRHLEDFALPILSQLDDRDGVSVTSEGSEDGSEDLDLKFMRGVEQYQSSQDGISNKRADMLPASLQADENKSPACSASEISGGQPNKITSAIPSKNTSGEASSIVQPQSRDREKFKCMVDGCIAGNFSNEFHLKSHNEFHLCSRNQWALGPYFCPQPGCRQSVSGFRDKLEFRRHRLEHGQEVPVAVCPYCPPESAYLASDVQNRENHLAIAHPREYAYLASTREGERLNGYPKLLNILARISSEEPVSATARSSDEISELIKQRANEETKIYRCWFAERDPLRYHECENITQSLFDLKYSHLPSSHSGVSIPREHMHKLSYRDIWGFLFTGRRAPAFDGQHENSSATNEYKAQTIDASAWEHNFITESPSIPPYAEIFNQWDDQIWFKRSLPPSAFFNFEVHNLYRETAEDNLGRLIDSYDALEADFNYFLEREDVISYRLVLKSDKRVSEKASSAPPISSLLNDAETSVWAEFLDTINAHSDHTSGFDSKTSLFDPNSPYPMMWGPREEATDIHRYFSEQATDMAILQPALENSPAIGFGKGVFSSAFTSGFPGPNGIVGGKSTIEAS